MKKMKKLFMLLPLSAILFVTCEEKTNVESYNNVVDSLVVQYDTTFLDTTFVDTIQVLDTIR